MKKSTCCNYDVKVYSEGMPFQFFKCRSCKEKCTVKEEVKCPKCRSTRYEEVCESGDWWNHCWDCGHDWEIPIKEIRFPELTVDLSKCGDTIDIEGKVHGQMKQHCFNKKLRQEFTQAIREGKTWADAIRITQEWVTVLYLPMIDEPLLGLRT